MEYKELPDEVLRALRKRNVVPRDVCLDNLAERFQEALRNRFLKRKSLDEELAERVWFLFNFNSVFRWSCALGAACVLLLSLLVGMGGGWGESNVLGGKGSGDVRYVTVNIDMPSVVSDEIMLINVHDKAPAKGGIRYVLEDEPYFADASMAF
jgi:hypothetical protein